MSYNGAGAAGIIERIMIIYSAVRLGYEWDLLLTHPYYDYE